jgi:hypothetical protein
MIHVESSCECGIETSCECGKETSGSIKCWETVGWLHNFGFSSSAQLIELVMVHESNWFFNPAS